jgi:hypothetical protein
MRLVRLLHIAVVAVLFLAAADVYKIKFDSTGESERVARMRGDIRRERDAIAALRAEFTRLDDPRRIEELARRHLPLKPIQVHQLDHLDQLPPQRPQLVAPGTPDPIGAVIRMYVSDNSLDGNGSAATNRR